MYMISFQRNELKDHAVHDIDLFFHTDLNEIVNEWIKHVTNIDYDELRKAVIEKNFRFTTYIRGNEKIKVRVSEIESGDYVCIWIFYLNGIDIILIYDNINYNLMKTFLVEHNQCLVLSKW